MFLRKSKNREEKDRKVRGCEKNTSDKQIKGTQKIIGDYSK